MALVLPALLALPVVTAPQPEARPVPAEVLSVPAADAAGEAVLERTSKGRTTAFSLVAVSWADDHDAAVTASVRARQDGRWGDWQEVTTSDLSASSAAVGGRGATDPVWLGETEGVQVRVRADGRRPRDLRVDLIDPGTSPADAHLVPSTPQDVATADDGRPTIISRAQWGADESLRGSCSTTTPPKAAIIHHTAGSNSYTADTAAAQLRADYAYHTRSLGWCDLGYNFVVDKFGRIYEGRAGGVDAEVRGAHAGGFNGGTFGVSALGNYDVVQPPAALVDALGRIAGWKLGRYGRNPQGTTTLTAAGASGTTSSYKDGESVTVPVVSGHRQLGSTACPGQYLFAQMDRIRSVAATTARATPLKSSSAEVQKLVKAFYLDFLGRPAETSGLEFWAGRIYRGESSAQQVALQMATTQEWTRTVVRDLYRSILRREPEGSGLDFWASRLQGDPSQVAAIAAQLYASQEYYTALGRNDDRLWVRALYNDILKREPDAGGLTTWTDHTRRHGRAWVATSFYASRESAVTRVHHLYGKFLGRRADSAGLETWPPLVVRDGDIVLAAFLAGSYEYFLRAQGRS